MSYIEVDQSGKIEQFNMDTVVALSNDRHYSVLLPKTVKQNIFIENKTTVRDLKYKLFAICLFYCLKEFIDEERKTVICLEYKGKDLLIKAELIRLLRLSNPQVVPKLIVFDSITKNSPAHKLAIAVLRKEKNADCILSRKMIEESLK